MDACGYGSFSLTATEQESANYGQRAKPSPLPALVKPSN